MASFAALGLMYLLGFVIAYAIYRGRRARMIAVVPRETWKTLFMLGGLAGLAYLVAFIVLVA